MNKSYLSILKAFLMNEKGTAVSDDDFLIYKISSEKQLFVKLFSNLVTN